MGRSRFDLVLFDLDGTLVDSERDLAAAVNHVREQFKRPAIDLLTIRDYIGNGVKTLIDRSFPDLTSCERARALTSFRNYYEGHLLDTTALYPGIREALNAMDVPVKIVLTNKTERYATTILERLGVIGYFAKVWGGDTGPKKKPDPDPVHRLLAGFSVSPDKAVMIGDGINDVLAARAAGIVSIAACYGYTSKTELAALGPDFLADSPGEFAAYIGG